MENVLLLSYKETRITIFLTDASSLLSDDVRGSFYKNERFQHTTQLGLKPNPLKTYYLPPKKTITQMSKNSKMDSKIDESGLC